MYTGYFGKVRSYPSDLKFVSIARFNRYWSGEKYMDLAPPGELLKIEDEATYTKLYYEKVLAKLDPRKVYDELGKSTVLLCYEKWDDIKRGKKFCHRHIVAKWLENNLRRILWDT